MPEFIPRSQFPTGLVEQLIRLQATRADPFLEATRGLQGSIGDLLGYQLKHKEQAQNLISGLLGKGAIVPERTGTVARGGGRIFDALPEGATALGPLLGRQFEGMALVPSPQTGKLVVTEDMAKKYPGLAVGTEIPTSFLASIEAKEKVQEIGRTIEAGKTIRASENELRDELNKLSGSFEKITKSYSDILAVSKSPSAAGDLSLIFSYMKMLDPESTVREGEQATAANARGVPDAIRNIYNRVMSGEKLAPGQRMDFISQSANLYTSQEQIQRERENSYRQLAIRNKVNPENVVIPRGLVKEKKVKPEKNTMAAGLDSIIDKHLVPNQ